MRRRKRGGHRRRDRAYHARSIYAPPAMTTIAIVGYGRFGSSFADLLAEAGVSVRAYDPMARVPEPLRVGSLAELTRGVDFVALSVPVPRMAEAVAALRPHLAAPQVVFDVGSVKVEPTAVMAAQLARDVPWVATHPLFGPMSLERGIRPLRAVICPSALHPSAAAEVTALYHRIGCEVMEQDADAHDRAMAYTHALAFFVAKGMIDAGVPMGLAYTTPSFQAIGRTIEAVRGDAGHLFTTLHRENPYAAHARRALLDALGAADRSLREPPADAAGPSALDIPDLGTIAPILGETRELIDEIDHDILALLARRSLLSHRAAVAEAAHGPALGDARRDGELLASRRRDAEHLGLDPDGVATIFQAVLQFSRKR